MALDLAKRVRTTDQFLGRVWWGAGSAAMGTGIWSMHFVGMQAAAFPFAVGFGYALTALSWVAAVAVSAIALSIASRTRLSLGRWVFGSLAMGAGICSMHYIGMAAMHMEPGIRWSVGWVQDKAAVLAASLQKANIELQQGRRRGRRNHGAARRTHRCGLRRAPRLLLCQTHGSSVFGTMGAGADLLLPS
ncbi:MAG: hypothetical protein EOP14_05050 [Pseudomonas sp.]|nr:MAG: hypothetical protein EOP14_05050 [Pseudomonas sp.]